MSENKAILVPFYFKKDYPQLKKSDVNWQWTSLQGFENCLIYGLGLFDDNKKCFGLLKQGTYVLTLNEGTRFLIWSRSLVDNTLSLSLYKTNDLVPITIDKENQKIINKKQTSYWFNALPISKIEIKLNPDFLYNSFKFPNDFTSIGEILLLTEIDGLYGEVSNNKFWHNTALIRLNTFNDVIEIFPQDHFNKSNADFGYVWMTQVQRDLKKNRIKVNGIRMNDFYLNKTNRQRKIINWL